MAKGAGSTFLETDFETALQEPKDALTALLVSFNFLLAARKAMAKMATSVVQEAPAIVSTSAKSKLEEQRGETKGVSNLAAAAAADVSAGISPLHGSELDTSSTATYDEHYSSPPIGEIQIPTLRLDATTATSAIGTSTYQPPNYEQLYFLSMRRNYRLKQNLRSVEEENRRLKRHLIEMQRRMFFSSRNKRIPCEAWVVPPSASHVAKRSRSNKCNVPQSVSTEEPSREELV